MFSFWDYPSVIGLFSFFSFVSFMLGCFFYSGILIYSSYWYHPNNISSLGFSGMNSFLLSVRTSNVRHISGISGLLMSLFFFTFIYVFGIFSPWCYPLGVHTVMITGISFSMWFMGVFCNILAEDFMYASHFCLPGDGLGLSAVMSDIEIISKFLQWITVSLRLSLNMIVGTFMIIGVFNLIGLSENFLCSFFWKEMSVMNFFNLFIIWGIGVGAFIYELMIMSLQIFLYMFLWQFYLKDSSCYRMSMN
uniref:ATP synthase F0 subunit 6 n=1 Tax=Thyasira tokunagai TaxID=3055801 RepID=UPI0030FF1AFA